MEAYTARREHEKATICRKDADEKLRVANVKLDVAQAELNVAQATIAVANGAATGSDDLTLADAYFKEAVLSLLRSISTTRPSWCSTPLRRSRRLSLAVRPDERSIRLS